MSPVLHRPPSGAKVALVASAAAINLLALEHGLEFDVFFTALLCSFLVRDALGREGPVALVVGGYALWNANSRFETIYSVDALAFVTLGIAALGYGVHQLRTDRIENSASKDDQLLQLIIVRRVFEELRTGPQTIDQLNSTLNHPESRIRTAVQFLADRNFVLREGDRVSLRAEADGFTGYVRFTGRSLLETLLPNRGGNG